MSDKTIFLRCLEKGCFRTKKVILTEELPRGTAEIHSYCPQHTEEGQKSYPEHYFDSNGNEI